MSQQSISCHAGNRALIFEYPVRSGTVPDQFSLETQNIRPIVIGQEREWIPGQDERLSGFVIRHDGIVVIAPWFSILIHDFRLAPMDQIFRDSDLDRTILFIHIRNFVFLNGYDRLGGHEIQLFRFTVNHAGMPSILQDHGFPAEDARFAETAVIVFDEIAHQPVSPFAAPGSIDIAPLPGLGTAGFMQGQCQNIVEDINVIFIGRDENTEIATAKPDQSGGVLTDGIARTGIVKIGERDLIAGQDPAVKRPVPKSISGCYVQ